MWGNFLQEVFPTPLSRTLAQRGKNRIFSLQIDSRREAQPRFCCREKSGATETLLSKRVHSLKNGPSRTPVPTKTQ